MPNVEDLNKEIEESETKEINQSNAGISLKGINIIIFVVIVGIFVAIGGALIDHAKSEYSNDGKSLYTGILGEWEDGE